MKAPEAGMVIGESPVRLSIGHETPASGTIAIMDMDENWRLLVEQDVQRWVSLSNALGPKMYPGAIRLNDRNWYVYRLWDADYECLYIGSSGWLSKRINDHKARVRGDWLQHVTIIDVCSYPDKLAMLAAERYWYDRLCPVFNTLRPRITEDERRAMIERNQLRQRRRRFAPSTDQSELF